jgi:hypothetical protein
MDQRAVTVGSYCSFGDVLLGRRNYTLKTPEDYEKAIKNN